VRIVVCSIGTSGDHRPYVAVALELHRRGHDVAAVIHPSYAHAAGAFPFPVHLAGTEFPSTYLLEHPEMLHPRRAFYEITKQLLLPDAAAAFQQLDRLHAAGKIDAVVAHHIAFGAIWWAESRGVPLTIGWLSPIAVMRPDGRGSMLPGGARRTPKLLAKMLRSLVPLIIRRELDAPMNATRAALGLPPQRDAMMRLLASEHGHIGLWDEAFRAPAAGDPRGLVTCGFPFVEPPDGEPPLPADVADFLAAEPPPIVCALGTTGGAIPLPVADLVAEACAIADQRALLIGDRPPSAARTSRWVEYAPHGRAFANAPLVVHHAGMGTLAAVLRAGKPSLVLPLANDQFDNGVRLHVQGVGSVLDPRKTKPRAIAREIVKLLGDRDAAYAASRMGARVRAANGAARAADAVLAHARGGQPP
jgi:rhamnosyltransferase subunit B